MTYTDFIAVIDLGTSHIVGMVGTKNQDDVLSIIAYDSEKSEACVRRGCVYNGEETANKVIRLIKKLEIEQKMPILRVNSTSGNYYIDNMGSVMPLSRHYVAHVLVASGYINKEFAMNELYHFVQFLQDNEFWNNQIDQIYVDADQEVELIPLVGNHKILLGSFDDYQKKLDNLKLFYEQAIPKVGWEKYSLINLKYRNQIVCTKR